MHINIKKDQNSVLKEEYAFKLRAGETKTLKLTEITLEKDVFVKGKYIVRATLCDEEHDLDTKSTSFYLEEKRETVKRGFIKDVGFADLNDPTIRNKPVKDGVLIMNFMHKDYINIESAFENKPQILTKQVGYYLMKLCLDEAARLLLLHRLINNESSKDVEDNIQEVREIQDRMYYEVYS